MKTSLMLVTVACGLAIIGAAPNPSSPVSDALRSAAERNGKNLVAAAEEMPADKYGFKPTPAQMSFGEVLVHLSRGNDFLCSKISGVEAPKRTEIAKTAPKDQLVARLRESFQFCETALAKVDDSALSTKVQFFGNNEVTPRGGDVRDGRGLGGPLQPAGDLSPAQRSAARQPRRSRKVEPHGQLAR